jgi:hypothetical protein
MLEYLRLMVMTRDDLGSKAVKDFDYSRAISSANEAAVLSSVIAAITAQLEKFPNDEAQDVALIADKGLFKTLSKNQRMAVRRESFSWNLNQSSLQHSLALALSSHRPTQREAAAEAHAGRAGEGDGQPRPGRRGAEARGRGRGWGCA